MVESLRRRELDHPGIDAPTRALLEFCGLVTQHAYRTTPEVIEGLRSLGWRDEQIAEGVFVTAMFAFFNRVADAFGLTDPGFLEGEASGQVGPRPAETFKRLPE